MTPVITKTELRHLMEICPPKKKGKSIVVRRGYRPMSDDEFQNLLSKHPEIKTTQPNNGILKHSVPL